MDFLEDAEIEPVCKNCFYYRELEHNFKSEKGYECSRCCTALMLEEKDAPVVETTPNDRCELFRDRDKAMVFKPGNTIYIIHRDMGNSADYIVEAMLIASCRRKVIVDINAPCTGINLDDFMNSAMFATRSDGFIKLFVFPLKDCFKTREEAETCMSAENDM